MIHEYALWTLYHIMFDAWDFYLNEQHELYREFQSFL